MPSADGLFLLSSFVFVFPFGYWLDGCFGHFDAGARGNLNDRLGLVGADNGAVYTVRGHDTVARLEAVAVLGFFFCLLTLGTDKEKVEYSKHCHYHDDSFCCFCDNE